MREVLKEHQLGMTVGELMEQLSHYATDTPVHFAYNYGDHWRTQVAAPVKHTDEGSVEWSEYHSMPKLTENEYYSEDDYETEVDPFGQDETKPLVVILSASRVRI